MTGAVITIDRRDGEGLPVCLRCMHFKGIASLLAKTFCQWFRNQQRTLGKQLPGVVGGAAEPGVAAGAARVWCEYTHIDCTGGAPVVTDADLLQAAGAGIDDVRVGQQPAG